MQEWTFRVVIPYRELTFEVRLQRPVDSPFVAGYTVRAPDADLARRIGLCKFHSDARSSSVGWIRDPIDEDIRVRQLP